MQDVYFFAMHLKRVFIKASASLFTIITSKNRSYSNKKYDL